MNSRKTTASLVETTLKRGICLSSCYICQECKVSFYVHQIPRIFAYISRNIGLMNKLMPRRPVDFLASCRFVIPLILGEIMQYLFRTENLSLRFTRDSKRLTQLLIEAAPLYKMRRRLGEIEPRFVCSILIFLLVHSSKLAEGCHHTCYTTWYNIHAMLFQ